jgi:hypothetical protein
MVQSVRENTGAGQAENRSGTASYSELFLENIHRLACPVLSGMTRQSVHKSISGEVRAQLTPATSKIEVCGSPKHQSEMKGVGAFSTPKLRRPNMVRRSTGKIDIKFPTVLVPFFQISLRKRM